MSSRGEEEFALHCQVKGITVEREYRFDTNGRRWRFDFAIPAKKIAIEIEGGTWIQGRHSRGSGYESDLTKYNRAAVLGWRILRYTPAMVTAGTAINQLEGML